MKVEARDTEGEQVIKRSQSQKAKLEKVKLASQIAEKNLKRSRRESSQEETAAKGGKLEKVDEKKDSSLQDEDKGCESTAQKDPTQRGKGEERSECVVSSKNRRRELKTKADEEERALTEKERSGRRRDVENLKRLRRKISSSAEYEDSDGEEKESEEVEGRFEEDILRRTPQKDDEEDSDETVERPNLRLKRERMTRKETKSPPQQLQLKENETDIDNIRASDNDSEIKKKKKTLFKADRRLDEEDDLVRKQGCLKSSKKLVKTDHPSSKDGRKQCVQAEHASASAQIDDDADIVIPRRMRRGSKAHEKEDEKKSTRKAQKKKLDKSNDSQGSSENKKLSRKESLGQRGSGSPTNPEDEEGGEETDESEGAEVTRKRIRPRTDKETSLLSPDLKSKEKKRRKTLVTENKKTTSRSEESNERPSTKKMAGAEQDLKLNRTSGKTKARKRRRIAISLAEEKEAEEKEESDFSSNSSDSQKAEEEQSVEDILTTFDFHDIVANMHFGSDGKVFLKVKDIKFLITDFVAKCCINATGIKTEEELVPPDGLSFLCADALSEFIASLTHLFDGSQPNSAEFTRRWYRTKGALIHFVLLSDNL